METFVKATQGADWSDPVFFGKDYFSMVKDEFDDHIHGE